MVVTFRNAALALAFLLGVVIGGTGLALVGAQTSPPVMSIPGGVYCSDALCLDIGSGSASTPTPQPTAPPKGVCEIGIIATTLNVRAAPIRPGDFPDVVARVHAPDVIQIEEVQWVTGWPDQLRVDEWARIDLGWVAINYSGGVYAAYRDGESDACIDIRFPTPPVTPTPAPPNEALLLGVHVLPGTAYENIEATGPLGGLKTTLSTFSLGLKWKQENPGGVWVHRPMKLGPDVRDCPTMEEWYSPSLYAGRFFENVRPGADYYEFMNECLAPAGDWEQFSRFTIEVLAYANARSTCLAWGSFAAGTPDYDAWYYLSRVIEWTDGHPCGVDRYARPRYHILALHQPLLMLSVPAPCPWAANEHIGRRHAIVNDLVAVHTGVQLSEHVSGRILLTEWGLDDGYCGDYRPLDNKAIARAVWDSVRVFTRDYPYVLYGYLWTYGGEQFGWTDRQSAAAEINNGR